MGIFYKIAVCGVISAILAAVIKQQRKEIALGLSLAACAVLLLCGVSAIKSVISVVGNLRDSAGLNSSVVNPLLKVCGICVLSQVSSTFCVEAGEGSIGKVIELCGGVSSVCAMLPLVDSILELVQGMLGG